MKEQTIKNIIDSYLKKRADIGLNKLPIQIEAEMSDLSQDKNEKWRIWFPIDSKVSDDEIDIIESRIGYKLPDDYKTFLKYKHFYELHISEVSFFRHPINSWKESLLKMIFDRCPTEYLIEKGYIPFADWSDWGLLCFDTNRNKENNNYPIVVWDHEMEDDVQDKYSDFYNLIISLDEEVRKNIS